jgi:hypothetical protein
LFNSLIKRADIINNYWDSYTDTEEHLLGVAEYCEILYNLYLLDNTKNDIIVKLNMLFERNNPKVNEQINNIYKKIIINIPTIHWNFSDVIINNYINNNNRSS